MPTLDEEEQSELDLASDDELLAAEEEQATAASGLSALQTDYSDVPGAAEALSALTKSTEAARQALRDARGRILARKYNRAIPLLAASAALGAPTRAGSTAEGFAAMAGALTGPLRDKAAFEERQSKELLDVDSGIAGLDQRMAKSQLELAALRAKLMAQARNAPNDPVMVDGVPTHLRRHEARGKRIAYPPTAGTNVTLNTGKSLYGALGDEMSKVYKEQYVNAIAAPKLIERSQRVRDVLEKNAFTGMGANFKLGFGKALQAVGLKFSENAIENTEVLATQLANNTLDLIGPSKLGSGTGFSNADRDFLERVAGGKLTLEKGSLMRLADLHDKAAVFSINQWNSSYDNLNPVELKTLGMVRIPVPQIGKRQPPAAAESDEGLDEEEGNPDDFAAAQAPPQALEYLRLHPEFKQEFLDKYGYLPPGF